MDLWIKKEPLNKKNNSRTLKVIFFFLLIVLTTLINPNNVRAEKRLKIAVIPFTNLSGKNDNDWIGAGFSETMISSLANLKNIQITERFLMNQVLKEVSFQQSGFIDDKSLVKVGKLTGANIIISGSFQIINNEIVVNSRFIDIEKGTVENGSAFYIRGEINKIFDLEEQLAKDFNEKFSLIPTEQENTSIKQVIYSTSSLEANKLYLQASASYINGYYNGKKEAIELLQKALKIDPNYSLALSLLGKVEFEYAYFNNQFSTVYKTKQNFDSLKKEATNYIKKALKITPELLEANYSMAYILFFEGKKEEAKIYLNKGLSINPNDVSLILLEGSINQNENFTDSYINKAFAIDNLNYEVYLEYGLYYLYFQKNETEKAISNLLKAVDLNPHSMLANMQLILAYVLIKDYKSATAWADRLILMDNKDISSYLSALIAYISSNDKNKMKESYIAVDKLSKGTPFEDSPILKYRLAKIYFDDKEYENAFYTLKNILQKYPEEPELNELISKLYLDYYGNCKFALYHYKIYVKSISKQKEEAEKNLKELNIKCGS